MNFSYQQYRQILRKISADAPIVFPAEVLKNKLQTYRIVRHDVEFSIQRALDLAFVEGLEGVRSTYMIQVSNNCYNVFSKENINRIQEIILNGHDIGLHAHLGNWDKNQDDIACYIKKQAHLLELAINYPVTTFSIHRPKKEHLKIPVPVSGLINLYGEEFFTYEKKFKKKNRYAVDVTYISDSNHEWKYGSPFNTDFSHIDKLQLNCHPFSWTQKGNDNERNFYHLTNEKNLELLDSINNEIKTYPELLYNETKLHILDRNYQFQS